jgi:hypothetical protein
VLGGAGFLREVSSGNRSPFWSRPRFHPEVEPLRVEIELAVAPDPPLLPQHLSDLFYRTIGFRAEGLRMTPLWASIQADLPVAARPLSALVALYALQHLQRLTLAGLTPKALNCFPMRRTIGLCPGCSTIIGAIRERGGTLSVGRRPVGRAAAISLTETPGIDGYNRERPIR